MTLDEFNALLDRLDLPEDYEVEVTQWCQMPTTKQQAVQPFEVRFALQLRKWRRDVDTGRLGWGRGGMYLLEPNISPSGVVLRVFKALLAYDEHELREAGLLLDGQNVLGPHPVLTESWTPPAT